MTLDELLSYVAGLFQQLVTLINQGAQGALNGVTTWLNSAVTGITNSLSNLLNSIGPVLTSLVSHIVDSIQQFIGPFLTTLNSVVQTVQTSLATLLADATSVFNSALQHIIDVTVSVISTVQTFINDAVAFFRTLAEQVIDAVHGFIQRTVDAISGIVATALTDVGAIFAAVQAGVTTGLGALLGVVQGTIQDVTVTVQAAWQQLVLGAESIIATVNERIGGLRDAFTTAAEQLTGALRTFDDERVKPLVDGALKALAFITSDSPDGVGTDLLLRADAFLTGPWDDRVIAPFTSGSFFTLTESPPLIRRLLWVLFQLIAVVPFVMGAAGAQAEILKQEMALERPWEVLSPGEVSAAYRRRLLQLDPAQVEIRKSGYSAERARTILDNAQEVPAEDVLLTLWLRGQLTDERLNEALFQRGYEPEWIAHLKEVAFEIPPLDDIIRMGRRLVFDPAIVDAFKLDDDFQQPVADWGLKKGLSLDWVKHYWAAHWDLPSVSQGFEMLQRGVIDRAQLDLLFRDAGMAPGWRDKLLQIAYRPFTRVDIRRMHKAGVLDEKAVTDAYLAIGYDAEKAATLTAFTLKLNAAKPVHDLGELGKVSTANVLTFLHDGVITQQEAIDLLVKAGRTQVSAEAFVFDEVLKMESHKRRDAVAHVVAQVKGGLLDFSGAQDELHKLGLTTPELDAAMLTIEKLEHQAVTLPTQAQGAAMLTAGVISEQDYRDLLALHGYAPKWIEAFLALEKGSNAGN